MVYGLLATVVNGMLLLGTSGRRRHQDNNQERVIQLYGYRDVYKREETLLCSLIIALLISMWL